MEHMAFKYWGPHWRLNIPKGSMVLEYLPTFTLAMAQFCRYTIHGDMEHMALGNSQAFWHV